MAPRRWSIEYAERAFRDLAALDKPVARRILAKLEAAAKDPPRFFDRLVGADEWKMRVGDWRIIVALAHERRKVIVLRVDHRSRVYER